MKKLFMSVLLLSLAPAANARECPEYLREMYSKAYREPVLITSKKEFEEKCESYIGNTFISSITRGSGHFKQNGKRKIKISYICLNENSQKILWGYVLER